MSVNHRRRAADREHMQTASRLRGVLVAVVLGVLAAAGLSASVVPSASAAEAGVNLIGSTSSQIPNLQALGTHWVRLFVSWPDIEPSQGDYSTFWMNYYEQTFRELPAGTKVLLDVVDSPSWETGSSDLSTPPSNPQEYAAMVGMLARHFGTKVSAYEIWNEEDASAWWAPGPDAAAYVALLKATYPAIKAADPDATVVLGGLTGNDYEFLEQVYEAGGKGYFDAVGVHTDTACNKLSPYEFVRGANERMVPDSFMAYREVHDVMVANGDEKPIWMTELSWRTTEATCPEGAWAGQTAEGVSEATQAKFLSQAYHCLAQAPYVKVALWFPLTDEGSVYSGLVRANGTRKPSFEAMQAYAREGDTLKEECGVLTGPKIKISSPRNRFAYRGPLPIHVSATSPDGVFRIRLEWNGKLIRNYDGPSFPEFLSGALEWQGAKHIPYGWIKLTFLAYDKERNVSSASIEVYHAPPKPKRSRKRH